MENVTVTKSALLEALKENRDAHQAIFEEALDGYKAETERLLKEHLKAVRSGKVQAIYVNLPVPEDHTRDYDRAIRMIDMSVDSEITIDETSFRQYVMDDWRWKHQFLSSNSTYSATAKGMLDSL